MATPEEIARPNIDAQLLAASWRVQNYKSVDFAAGSGIALREVPLKARPCDYLVFVDRTAVGVIEAKKEGATLSTDPEAERSLRVVDELETTANLTAPASSAGQSIKKYLMENSTRKCTANKNYDYRRTN